MQRAFPNSVYCISEVEYPKIEEREVVELNGKKYDKKELEEALRLIKPVK